MAGFPSSSVFRVRAPGFSLPLIRVQPSASKFSLNPLRGTIDVGFL